MRIVTVASLSCIKVVVENFGIDKSIKEIDIKEHKESTKSSIKYQKNFYRGKNTKGRR